MLLHLSGQPIFVKNKKIFGFGGVLIKTMLKKTVKTLDEIFKYLRKGVEGALASVLGESSQQGSGG